MKGIACTGATIAVLALPAVANADQDFFVVDTTSDSVALTACTGAAADCSLRGAFANANDGDPVAEADTIVFDSTVFDGVETVPGEATIVLGSPLDSNEDLVLGTSCSTTKPCAGIDGPAADNALQAIGGDFSMNGVAVFGSGVAGLFKGSASGEMQLVNNYFGLKLDGTPDGNSVGLALSGDDVQLGGSGSTPNFFGGNTTGLSVFTADEVTVEGNVFGLRPNLSTLAANTSADIEIASNINNDGAEGITIGGTPNLSTAACDEACNLIAAAGGPASSGIKFTTQGSDSAGANVNIQGNHIGVSQNGSAASGTSGNLVSVGSADDVTVADNHLAGGVFGISSGSSAEGTVIEDNFVGTTPGGAAVLDGASAASIFVNSNGAVPTRVRGNTIVADTLASSVIVGNQNAVVDQNVIGIEDFPNSGGSSGIDVGGSGHLIEENTIVSTAANGIWLVDASDSEVAGNTIGVPDGPIGGDGIRVEAAAFSSQGNKIGSSDAGRANTFSDITTSAIGMVGDGQDSNEILQNLGDSADVFIDLEGTVGPGNGGAGPNGGIEAPKVKKAKAGKKKVSGSGLPDAKVWVYRTSADAGDYPTGLEKLVGKKSVKNDGSWELKPDKKLKKNQVVTALQIDGNGNSSELSKGEKVKK